jgi:hypothetical protein
LNVSETKIKSISTLKSKLEPKHVNDKGTDKVWMRRRRVLEKSDINIDMVRAEDKGTRGSQRQDKRAWRRRTLWTTPRKNPRKSFTCSQPDLHKSDKNRATFPDFIPSLYGCRTRITAPGPIMTDALLSSVS